MANTYTSLYYHIVFGTKNGDPLITADVQDRLWPYIGGIARENEMKAISVGGVANHVHILLSIPKTMAVSKALQLIKGGSSKWIHETFPHMRLFSWQDGYGAFTVGESQIPRVKGYIENQPEHHRAKTFREEYLAFLKEHHVEYDERYVFG